MPARLTAALDRYSDWAGRPCWPGVVRMWKWRYQVMVMDWVSLAGGLALVAGTAAIWGWRYGLIITAPSYIAAAIVYEVGRTMTNEPARPLPPPSPDRLTAASRDRYRAELEGVAAMRRAMLAQSAPFWMRMLAWLPNPQKPLENWVTAEKARMRNRL
jgi:hypothetical protein